MATESVLWGVMPDGTPVRITSGTLAHCQRELGARWWPDTAGYWSGFAVLEAGRPYPHARHGWVTVAPGVLRPAVLPGTDPITGEPSAAPGTVWYSPEGAGSWRDAPAGIAGTFLLQYVAGEWRPFTVPDGYRIAS
jgi:hypothetical protein